jgi:type I restriction enzyme S subunit
MAVPQRSATKQPLGKLLRRPPRYGLNAAAVTLSPETFTYIRITDIDESGRFAPRPKVGVSHPRSADYFLGEDELVFARTGASVGKSYLYDPRDGKLVYAGFLINIAPDKRVLDPKYLALVTQTKEYWDWVARTSVRSGQPGINGREFAQFPVSLPDINTQKSIAAAATDVEDLIITLECLINKKLMLKQGMMQELLTGRTRLPGFQELTGFRDTDGDSTPRGWRICDLKSVSTMHGRIGWQGLKQSEFTSNPSDPYLITGMNFKDGEIDWQEVYHVSRERYDVAPEIQLQAGDVLMTKDGTIGKLLYVRNIPNPGLATLNSHLLVFRPINDSYNPRYLYYHLSSRRFLQHIELHKSGSTFFGISQASIGKYKMLLPSIEEQGAIAKTLSDIDAEIAILQQHRDKIASIKQGMIQELLTDRTCLPIKEVAT